jgi:tRNA G18 (ribose-2'-O)-methylase SpoU
VIADGPVEDATPDLAAVGVGPHPPPWPEDGRYDPELLAHGDRRNVVDRYRYWSVEAIVADLDGRRHEFAVAIENWSHDMNIGTVVRTANAFQAAEVVIVGRRRWNRRGAMVTDRYQHVHHVDTAAELAAFAEQRGYTIVAVDNLPGAVAIETLELPKRALLLFGQESVGLTDSARSVAAVSCAITQYGSTRSINAGVAAGIAMHAWIRQHAEY